MSLYPLSDEDTALLGAKTDLAAWPQMRRFSQPDVLQLPDLSNSQEPLPSPHPQHAAVVRACCDALITSEDDLNVLDARTGDADTTVATAAREVINRLDHLPLGDLTQLFPALSRELTQTMGGSSGVLLAIFSSAAGEASASGGSFSSALKFGLARLKEVDGARLGDRTMIDALEPALDALDGGLQVAAVAARSGASKTAAMATANAGRSAYVNAQQLTGNVDPGAEAVARVFEHIAA